MNKNPFVNAVLAALYIALVVFLMDTISKFSPKEDNIFMPMLFLGMFVLSAAVMSYLFIYEPLKLHLDNQRPEALKFFFKTLGTFAVLVGIFLFLVLSF